MTSRTAAAARFVSLLFAGIFAGFLLTALIVELSLRRFDGTIYTQVQHVLLIGMPAFASATLFPAIVSTAVLVVVLRARGRGRWLTLSALILLVAAFVISLTINVPINARELTWNAQTPPSDWADVRDRWQIAHAIRTSAVVIAFGLLGAAATRKSLLTA
jgi:uncharacterized membrane protein